MVAADQTVDIINGMFLKDPGLDPNNNNHNTANASNQSPQPYIEIHPTPVEVPIPSTITSHQFRGSDPIDSWLATHNLSEFILFFKETQEITTVSDLAYVKSLSYQQLENFLKGSNMKKFQRNILFQQLQELQISG